MIENETLQTITNHYDSLLIIITLCEPWLTIMNQSWPLLTSMNHD